MDAQDVVLNFDPCQREFCFEIGLKNVTRPSARERFAISVERMTSRIITLDPEKTHGFISIL